MSEITLTKKEKKYILQMRKANNNFSAENGKVVAKMNLKEKDHKKKKEHKKDHEHNETHYHAHFFGGKKPIKRMKRHHLDLILSQIGLYLPERTVGLSLIERKAMASPEQKDLITKLVRQYVNEVFGTEEPEIKAYGQVVVVKYQSGGPTFDVLVVAPSFSGCQNFSSWGAIFDEFKYIRGTIRTIPITIPGKCNPKRVAHAPGYIDYADATTPASYNGTLCADTSKIFSLESYEPEKHMQEWELRPQQQPDMAWRPTQDTTAVIWWKWYPPTFTLTGTTLANDDMVFFVTYVWTLKMRQVTAI